MDYGKALGQTITITGFADGKDRELTPFKLKDMKEFMKILEKIRPEEMIYNFIVDPEGSSLKEFYLACFKDCTEDELFDVITVVNYKHIMKQIFDALGLSISSNEKNRVGV